MQITVFITRTDIFISFILFLCIISMDCEVFGEQGGRVKQEEHEGEWVFVLSLFNLYSTL